MRHTGWVAAAGPTGSPGDGRRAFRMRTELSKSYPPASPHDRSHGASQSRRPRRPTALPANADDALTPHLLMESTYVLLADTQVHG